MDILLRVAATCLLVAAPFFWLLPIARTRKFSSRGFRKSAWCNYGAAITILMICLITRSDKDLNFGLAVGIFACGKFLIATMIDRYRSYNSASPDILPDE